MGSTNSSVSAKATDKHKPHGALYVRKGGGAGEERGDRGERDFLMESGVGWYWSLRQNRTLSFCSVGPQTGVKISG